MIQDDFFIMLNNIFNNLQKKGTDGYLILKLELPLNQLYKLYTKMEVSEITPIEMLNEEEKLKYWNIGKSFYTDKDTAIKASKAAYILNLITSP